MKKLLFSVLGLLIAISPLNYGVADTLRVIDGTTGKATKTSSPTVTNLVVEGTLGLTGALTATADLTIYDATNDGNPQVRIGSADAEEVHIQSTFQSGTQILEYVDFQTDTASVTANYGAFRFNVDGSDILDIDDGGIDLDTGGALSINGTDVLDATTLGSGVVSSSLTSVGTLTSATISGDLTMTGGQIVQNVVTIPADDTTPDVSTGNIFETSANTGGTAITAFDNETAGQIIIVVGGSDTNSTTIADSGNFALSGAFTAAADDVLVLYVQGDNDYIELSRTDN